jgi:hypothetical protein
MIPSGNPGGHLAHIGGALFGFGYIQFLKMFVKSAPGRPWFWISSLFKNLRSRKKTSAAPDNTGRPLSDEEYNFKKKENQKRIDEILEKISKGGYDSLTKTEKEFLFKTSGKR